MGFMKWNKYIIYVLPPYAYAVFGLSRSGQFGLGLFLGIGHKDSQSKKKYLINARDLFLCLFSRPWCLLHC